jgi:CO/xanthine dehydrogenase Mo-binding subunit
VHGTRRSTARASPAARASGQSADHRTGTYEQTARVYGTTPYAVEVTVDAETGAFHVVDAELVADVGTVINPGGARQLEGASRSGSDRRS